MTAFGVRVERLLCPIGTCEWTHDRETPPAEARTFPDGQPPLHDGPPKDLCEAIADVAFATLLHDAQRTESVIRAHLETHTIEDWVRETARLRSERPTRWPRDQHIPLVSAGQTYPGGYAPQWWQAVEEYHQSQGDPAPVWYEHAMTAAGINEALTWWNERADALAADSIVAVPRRLLEQLREIAAYVSLGRRAVDHQPDGAPYPDAQARFALAELGDLIGRPEQTDAPG